jgi:hypothetical protein
MQTDIHHDFVSCLNILFMRKLFVLAILFLGFMTLSCKKTIQEAFDQAGGNILTDNAWVVTNYTEGTLDVTSEFSGWEHFFLNNGVFESRRGTTIVQGNWSSASFVSDFVVSHPSSVTAPISKLNGTWQVLNRTATSATFRRTASGVTLQYTLAIK